MRSYQLPFSTSPAQPLGQRLWRKHALSYGSWTDAHGRTLTVDRPLLDRVVSSFRAGALDQVPFQLAGADNSHTDDPERYRGEIKGLDIGNDGLYVTTEMTPEGARVVKDNPNLGVSVRLMGECRRGDGQTHKDVLGHVLGTLRPQVPGLRAWEAIQMAADAGEVVDLTAGVDASTMAETAPEDALTPEMTAAITALIKQVVADLESQEDKEMSNTDLSPAELAALTADANQLELSADATKRLEESEQRARDAENGARAVEARAAWREKRVELSQSGVPPVLLDMADPVMSRPAPAEPAVYEMAAGDGKPPVKVTERDVVNALLAEAKGRVQVNRETGTSELSNPDDAEHERILSRLRAADSDHRPDGNGDLVKAIAAGVASAMKAHA